MFCCASTPQHKKHMVVCMFVLLAFSTLVQAEAVSDMDSVSHVSNTDSEHESSVTNLRQSYKYPRWPIRRMAAREVIPPPPPGPYMSSALSGFTVKGLSFSRDSSFDRDADSDFDSTSDEVNDSEFILDSSGTEMGRFSPDIPWPKNLKSKNTRLPNRWMPDSGYRYVNPREQQKTGTQLQNRHPFMGDFVDDYGYRMPGDMFPKSRFPKNRLPESGVLRPYRPIMNQRVEHRMPSMSVDLREQGINNSGMNNYGIRSTNPGYRRPGNRAASPTQ